MCYTLYNIYQSAPPRWACQILCPSQQINLSNIEDDGVNKGILVFRNTQRAVKTSFLTSQIFS